MPKKESALQSWNILFFARKHLGRSLLYSIFGRKNSRAVDYWCEDPHYTNKPDNAYDPLKGCKILIETLDDHGHCAVVRSTIAYLASGTSLDCGIANQVIEPLPTISEEILADYRAVADLQQAIDSEADMEEIELLKQDAIAEIERTVAKARELRR